MFGRTYAQWNAYFGAKADANNGTLCNPTIIGGSEPGSFTVNPGLTGVTGTRNTVGNTVGPASTISPQLYPVYKASSYTVNSDSGGLSDSGAVLVAHGSLLTFALPNPASGTIGVTYNFVPTVYSVSP